MKSALTGAAALMLTTAAAGAGGIERAPQSLAPLFEPAANYVELSFGRVMPEVTGKDVAVFGGLPIGNVAKDYSFFGLAYKRQLSDNLSAALIIEQPFGADLLYPTANPAAGAGSIALGGTAVEVNSTTYTALLRYRMDNNFGVHAGIRGSTADGEVSLKGLAYGPVNGYNVQLDRDAGWGYAIGVSYEKPEIAARISLTYNSPIEHKFSTVETINGAPINPAGKSETTVDTPKSWNLEFQTGVAPDTLVFGSIRWVDWSSFRVEPAVFTNLTKGGLVSLEDSTTYTIGIGRKFTENWSGAASVNWEKKGDNLVSPLAPTNGRRGMTLSAIYTMDNVKITTGINYTRPGDADPETGTPDTARANMRNNKSIGVGLKVGVSF